MANNSYATLPYYIIVQSVCFDEVFKVLHACTLQTIYKNIGIATYVVNPVVVKHSNVN